MFLKVMRGVSDAAYAGVGLDRTVVQMPGYIADIYRAWSNAEHTYDYPLCFRGALDAREGAEPETLEPMGAPTTRGYKHISVQPPVDLATNWTGTWRRDDPANDVRARTMKAWTTNTAPSKVPEADSRGKTRYPTPASHSL